MGEEIVFAIDEVWLMFAAALVMLMQAGFALLEAGFTQAKHAGNLIMKNFMDFSAGAIAYWAIGFGLAYGGSSLGGFLAYGDGFFFNDASRASDWLFQVMFAATAATIVGGAIAGRTKFSAYLIFTPLISGLVYPIATHWVWGGGWLAELGYFDFAGSGVVHLLGGISALAAAIVVGPRIGRFDEEGKPVTIPGHSLTIGALGVFILWFGWYGFNGGSTLAAVGVDIAFPMVTTTLAAAAGAFGAMTTAWITTGRPDVALTVNGVLGGLVGITAGAASIGFGASILTGFIGGAIVVVAVRLLERLRIDDVVGAFPVHGAAGIWGVIAVALFSSDADLGPQLIGIMALVVWGFGSAFVLFKTIDKLVKLRVSPEGEIAGLDRSEHGSDAYPEFMLQGVSNGVGNGVPHEPQRVDV